jgi:predicted membrane-bound mannosyltransferase
MEGGQRETRDEIRWLVVALGFSSLALRLTEAQLRVVHMASSWRLCREEAEDGWVDVTDCFGPFYHKIVVFSVLGSSDIVVFCLGL